MGFVREKNTLRRAGPCYYIACNKRTYLYVIKFRAMLITPQLPETALCCATPMQVGSDFILTALHGMQTRSSDENSVCLSVCPSVRQTRAL